MRTYFAAEQRPDADYRRTTNRLGATMLIFFALFFLLSFLADAVSDILTPGLDRVSKTVVEELCDGVAYALSFVLPLLLLRRITPREQRLPLPLSPTLPRRPWLWIPAGVAITHSAAVSNAFLMRVLGLSSSAQTGPFWVDGMPLHEALLLLITSVLIPAFFEELLFRGAILSALLPYGKTIAVIGSAVLFGVMHQNADQLLYTTLAGIVLGVLVVKSGSIWAGVLLHLFNNLFAVVEKILYERMTSSMAVLLFGIFEMLVIGFGVICLIVLITREDRLRERTGNTADALLGGQERPQHAVRGFFTPMMLLFLADGMGQMIWRLCIFS